MALKLLLCEDNKCNWPSREEYACDSRAPGQVGRDPAVPDTPLYELTEKGNERDKKGQEIKR